MAEDHEWQSTPNDRINQQQGCPCCDGKKVVQSNCLKTTHPEIAKEWHPTKNGNLTAEMVTVGRDTKVWWKCSMAEDHEWQATIYSRTKGNGCSCCRGLTAVTSNCLATTHPEIAKEWHPSKNENLIPHMLTAGSRKKVWWQCSNNHEWQAVVSQRTRGNGCQQCKINSIGEKRIEEILYKNNILFQKQWNDKSCRDIKPLLFDFAVKINDRIKLIEYQGQQHYKPISFGAKRINAKTMFDKVRKHDTIKKNWCLKKNIQLLEIPYWKLKDIIELIKDFCEL
jgi:hypothetical protein